MLYRPPLLMNNNGPKAEKTKWRGNSNGLLLLLINYAPPQIMRVTHAVQPRNLVILNLVAIKAIICTLHETIRGCLKVVNRFRHI